MLAETPQPSGGLLLIFLLFLLGVAAAHVAIVGMGCLWALRAGRGTQGALVGFLLVGIVEVLYVIVAVPSLFRGEPNYYFASALLPLGAQVTLYLGARRGSGRVGGPGA